MVGFKDSSWGSRCLVRALPALPTSKREGREMTPGPLLWAWLELKSRLRVKSGVWKREWRLPLPGQVP